ncbi:MAG: SCO family protein [Telluria sp.]
MKHAFSLVLILSLLAGGVHAAPAPAMKSGVFEPPRVAPEIVLPSSHGEFKLSRFLGKVVVLEFGYTTCVDVCPVSLAALADARKKLGAAGADVQVVFISVDPARDTPARLKKYVATFDASFIGVTGTQTQIVALLTSYGISAAKRVAGGDAKNYFMSHSSYLYFIDRKGMQRAMMPFGRPSAEMVHDLKLLLKP